MLCIYTIVKNNFEEIEYGFADTTFSGTQL